MKMEVIRYSEMSTLTECMAVYARRRKISINDIVRSEVLTAEIIQGSVLYHVVY